MDIPDVPQYLVDQVLGAVANGSESYAPWETLEQRWETMRELAKQIAGGIWRQAFVTGASYGMSIANQAKYMVVTEDQYKKIMKEL